MFDVIFNAIKNGILWVFNQIVNIASEIFDFVPFLNFVKRIINFFPPLLSSAIIIALVFLTGLAVKRIFFS